MTSKYFEMLKHWVNVIHVSYQVLSITSHVDHKMLLCQVLYYEALTNTQSKWEISNFQFLK